MTEIATKFLVPYITCVLLLASICPLCTSLVENKVLNTRDWHTELRKFIIGGRLAKPQRFPYAVSIQELDYFVYLYEHICTGSLITPQSVLTAAHCVVGLSDEIRELEDYRGVLGTVNRKDDTNAVTFGQFRVHPNYDSELVLNDIAILVILDSTKFGNLVKTVPLIGPRLLRFGMHATAIGWGRTQTGSRRLSGLLRYVQLDVADNEICEEYFGELIEGHFCYGTEGKGVCNGDSGSPVVITFREKEVQIGITSFGGDWCAKGPSVGTNVGHYNKWIQNNVVGRPDFIV